MLRRVGIPAAVTGVVGLALLTLGVVYITVACESLPGFMGQTQGDTSPRTGLGIACLVLGMAVFGVALVAARRGAQPKS